MSGPVRIDARGMIVRAGNFSSPSTSRGEDLDPELGRPLQSPPSSSPRTFSSSSALVESDRNRESNSQTSHSTIGPFSSSSSASSSYLQHQDRGEEENDSSSSSTRRVGAFLRYIFIRPFCCFPQAAAARPSSLSSRNEDFSASTCCWYPPILGFSPIFLITVSITIGLSVAAHFYWQPVLLTGVVVCGYIISVALHEFAHAATAYKGGDESVVYSGYLTLDYLRYASPLFSLGLPLIFLLLGSVALPGAAVLIQHDQLRGRKWKTLTALAGPLANLLCGFLASGILQLTLIWETGFYYTVLHMSLACLVYFQAMSVILNVIPLPPLDGWAAVEPWLPSGCFLKKAMNDPTLRRVIPLAVLALLFPLFARVPFFALAVRFVAVEIFRAPMDLTPLSVQYFSLSYSQWRYVHPIPIPHQSLSPIHRVSSSSSFLPPSSTAFPEDFMQVFGDMSS
ncbi:peptidase m50 [Cystoisospora suis]|uniref:Peptidase m50 n=1 Tax=Cystoisospora suis TaxID=483139 RepID=A0A2C6KBJ2_9APIC|nr:peptidase m50 [Cystoisospora suis]